MRLFHGDYTILYFSRHFGVIENLSIIEATNRALHKLTYIYKTEMYVGDIIVLMQLYLR